MLLQLACNANFMSSAIKVLMGAYAVDRPSTPVARVIIYGTGRHFRSPTSVATSAAVVGIGYSSRAKRGRLDSTHRRHPWRSAPQLWQRLRVGPRCAVVVRGGRAAAPTVAVRVSAAAAQHVRQLRSHNPRGSSRNGGGVEHASAKGQVQTTLSTDINHTPGIVFHTEDEME